MSIVILHANGSMTTPTSLTFEEARQAVDGFVQVVRLPGSDASLLVNEDGQHLKLPVNLMASRLFNGVILGTVVLVDAEAAEVILNGPEAESEPTEPVPHVH